jgi:fructokinase
MTLTTDRTIFCIGEILLDIIFRDGIPVAARPGGSMLNSAVSLARAGSTVRFIGETGTDRVSGIILDFLQKNHVETPFISQNPGARTALALAFLDSSGDASYSFYPSGNEPQLGIDLPVAGKNDIVLFGSFYSLSARIRETLVPFLNAARENGALIVYDPNFRKPHLPGLKQVLPFIRENIALADIIRGSDEDFIHIFAAGNPGQVFEILGGSGDKVLVYTQNSREVRILRHGMDLSVPVPQIEPVSTIGAGDAFNAGLIHWMIGKGIRKNNLAETGTAMWREIAGTGIRFSADVCLSLDNYISEPFASGLKR